MISGAANLQSVYFIGIGGIGMSAIARYFVSRGVKVSGYDKTSTILTKQLEKEGMHIHYEDNVELIDKEADIVVFTPAIPASHSEFNFYRDQQYPLMKRSEVLGLITESHFNICVAGTHGKTTTSAMVAHILRHTGYSCNAFLGGIASNYDTNFWSSKKDVYVVEADEYDRSFLQLSPDVAIITAMDADHLDIYGTEEMMQNAFVTFTEKIREDGLLIYKKGIARSADFKVEDKMSYATSDETADVYTKNIRIKNGSYFFDIKIANLLIEDVALNMGGKHNIENALAAIAVAYHVGIEVGDIKAAVADFAGVKRRFEYLIKNEQLVLIDDYAHHPEELRALINSAKELFEGRKCTVVFQPHLYSRTNDLAEGFAEVLSMADETILLPIYPARELPMTGVSSELILNKMTNSNKSIQSKESVMQYLASSSFIKENVLLIFCGAGDIDTMLQPVKELLST
ncbi:MAG: UDP-N-acetylmuramate--L-alanine ligase [Ferruginibacter sp.]